MLPNQFANYYGATTKRFQKVNKYIGNILWAMTLLASVLVIGIIGYMYIDDYTFGEAFYMTIITLSTVGYGEVKPLSPNGQVFTSILLVFTLGLFAYSISIISSSLMEGGVSLFVKDYIMYKKIEQLSNHTIVCGFGRHGRQICDELTKSNLPFIVIEPDVRKFEEFRELKYFFMEGDAAEDDVLITAGILRAKAIVITYNESAINVYTVLTARQLNPKLRIITRGKDHIAEKKLMRAGANHVVLTEVIGGFYMATLIHQPNVVEFFSIISNMGDVSIHFKEVEYLQMKNEYRDKSIINLGVRSQTGVNIIAVRHVDGHYDVNPKPTTAINEGMTLVILGALNQIKSFEQIIMIDPH